MCSDGALWSWRLARSLAIAASKSASGRVCSGTRGPPGFRFNLKKLDCGSQGRNVEDVNVVLPFKPHMSEVQELKRKMCTVGRESGGGTEVLQEVSALLAVEPLSV